MITHLATAAAFGSTELEVTGEAYRHLFLARRLGRGAALRVVDGAGRARRGEVTEVDRRRAVVRLGDALPANEPAYALHLLVAALRPERASWLVEKATELGAAGVHFFRCSRTPRDYGSGRLERLRRVAAAAVEQCHRSRLPEVTGVHPWEEVAELLEPTRDRWMLDVAPIGEAPAGTTDEAGAAEAGAADRLSDRGREGARSVLLRAVRWLRARRPSASTPSRHADRLSVRALGEARSGSGAVVVGPEGGWSEEERRELRALGCRPVSLGPRVLRVETAALAAAAGLLVEVEWE